MNNDKVIKELLAFAEENKSVKNNLFTAGIQYAIGYAIGTIIKNEEKDKNSQET